MESMWSQFQNLNGIILSKSTELLGWYRIHCGDQCQTSWASRNPIFEYQLSWNLINAYQELKFFIFKCGVFHIISDFYLPLSRSSRNGISTSQDWRSQVFSWGTWWWEEQPTWYEFKVNISRHTNTGFEIWDFLK